MPLRWEGDRIAPTGPSSTLLLPHLGGNAGRATLPPRSRQEKVRDPQQRHAATTLPPRASTSLDVIRPSAMQGAARQLPPANRSTTRCAQPVTSTRSTKFDELAMRRGVHAEQFVGSELQDNSGLVSRLISNSDEVQQVSDVVRRHLDKKAIDQKRILDAKKQDLEQRQVRNSTPGVGANRDPDWPLSPAVRERQAQLRKLQARSESKNSSRRSSFSNIKPLKTNDSSKVVKKGNKRRLKREDNTTPLRSAEQSLPVSPVALESASKQRTPPGASLSTTPRPERNIVSPSTKLLRDESSVVDSSPYTKQLVSGDDMEKVDSSVTETGSPGSPSRFGGSLQEQESLQIVANKHKPKLPKPWEKPLPVGKATVGQQQIKSMPLTRREEMVLDETAHIDVAAVNRAELRRQKIEAKRKAAHENNVRFFHDAPCWMLPPQLFDDTDSDSDSSSHSMSDSMMGSSTSLPSARLKRSLSDLRQKGHGKKKRLSDERNRVFLQQYEQTNPNGEHALTKLSKTGGVPDVGGEEQRVRLQKMMDRRSVFPTVVDAEVQPKYLPATAAYMHIVSMKRMQHQLQPAALPNTITDGEKSILKEALGHGAKRASPRQPKLKRHNYNNKQGMLMSSPWGDRPPMFAFSTTPRRGTVAFGGSPYQGGIFSPTNGLVFNTASIGTFSVADGAAPIDSAVGTGVLRDAKEVLPVGQAHRTGSGFTNQQRQHDDGGKVSFLSFEAHDGGDPISDSTNQSRRASKDGPVGADMSTNSILVNRYSPHHQNLQQQQQPKFTRSSSNLGLPPSLPETPFGAMHFEGVPMLPSPTPHHVQPYQHPFGGGGHSSRRRQSSTPTGIIGAKAVTDDDEHSTASSSTLSDLSEEENPNDGEDIMDGVEMPHSSRRGTVDPSSFRRQPSIRMMMGRAGAVGKRTSVSKDGRGELPDNKSLSRRASLAMLLKTRSARKEEQVSPPLTQITAEVSGSPNHSSQEQLALQPPSEGNTARKGGFALPVKFIRYASNNTHGRSILSLGAGGRPQSSTKRKGLPFRRRSSGTIDTSEQLRKPIPSSKLYAEHAIPIELIFTPGCRKYLTDDQVRQLAEPYGSYIHSIKYSDRGGRFISILCDELLQGLKGASKLLSRVRRGEVPSISEAYIAPRCGVEDGCIDESPRDFDLTGDEKLPMSEVTVEDIGWGPSLSGSQSLGAVGGNGGEGKSTQRKPPRVSISDRKQTLLSSPDGSPNSIKQFSLNLSNLSSPTKKSSLAPSSDALKNLKNLFDNFGSTDNFDGQRSSARVDQDEMMEGDNTADTTPTPSPQNETPRSRRARMLRAMSTANANEDALASSMQSMGTGTSNSLQTPSLSTHGVTPKAWGNSSVTTPSPQSLGLNAKSRNRTVTISAPGEKGKRAKGASAKPGARLTSGKLASASGKGKRKGKKGKKNGADGEDTLQMAEEEDPEVIRAREREEELLMEFQWFVDETLMKSNRVAIIVSMTHFEDPSVSPINFAGHDAEEFSSLLTNLGYTVVRMAPNATRWFLQPTVVNILNVLKGFLEANGSGAGGGNPGGGGRNANQVTSGHPVTAVFMSTRGFVGTIPGLDGAECEVALAYDSHINELNPTNVILPAQLATMTDAVGKQPFIFVDCSPIAQNPYLTRQNNSSPKFGTGYAWLTSHVEEGGNELLVQYPRYVQGLCSYYLKRALQGRAINNQTLHLSTNAILWYINSKLQNRNCRVQHNAIVAKVHSVFFSMFVFPSSKYVNYNRLMSILADEDRDEFQTEVRLNCRLRCRIANEIGGEEPLHSLRKNEYFWVRHLIRHVHGFIYPKEKKVKMFDRRKSSVKNSKHVEHANRVRAVCIRQAAALITCEYRDVGDLLLDNKRRGNFERDFVKLNSLCKKFRDGELGNFFGERDAIRAKLRARFKGVASLAGAALAAKKGSKISLAGVASLLLKKDSLMSAGSQNVGGVASSDGSAYGSQYSSDEEGGQMLDVDQRSRSASISQVSDGADHSELVQNNSMFIPPHLQEALEKTQEQSASMLSAGFTLTSGMVTIKVHGAIPRPYTEFVLKYLHAAAAKKTAKGATPVVMYRKAHRLHYTVDVSFVGSKRDQRKLDRLMRQQALNQHFLIESLVQDPFDPSDHAIVERVQAAFRGHLVRRVIREQRELREEEEDDRRLLANYEDKVAEKLFGEIHRRLLDLCEHYEQRNRWEILEQEGTGRYGMIKKVMKFIQDQEANIRLSIRKERDLAFLPLRETGIRLSIRLMAYRYFRSTLTLHWFITGVYWDRYYNEMQLYQTLLQCRSDFKFQHRDLDLRIGPVIMQPKPPSAELDAGHSVIGNIMAELQKTGTIRGTLTGANEPMFLPQDSMIAFSSGFLPDSKVMADSVMVHFRAATPSPKASAAPAASERSTKKKKKKRSTKRRATSAQSPLGGSDDDGDLVPMTPPPSGPLLGLPPPTPQSRFSLVSAIEVETDDDGEDEEQQEPSPPLMQTDGPASADDSSASWGL